MGGYAVRRGRERVILHFAYGLNMSRAIMRKHAPDAEPLGVAALADHRFLITADGYASVARAHAQTVYGVLWRLTPRDRATLDRWENVAEGLYRATTLPVHQTGHRRVALTYVARRQPTGRAKAGYMEIVIAAALEWQLPVTYIRSLQRWRLRQPGGAGPRELVERI